MKRTTARHEPQDSGMRSDLPDFIHDRACTGSIKTVRRFQDAHSPVSVPSHATPIFMPQALIAATGRAPKAPVSFGMAATGVWELL